MNTNMNIAQDVIGQISFAVEQHPEGVAQLFADYGIKAPVNESSVLDAIVVFKEPFLNELNAIIDGAEDGILGIGKGKNKNAQPGDENCNTKKPLQKLGNVIKKVVPLPGGNRRSPGGPDAPNPSPTPPPPNPSPRGNPSNKLNLGEIIDTAQVINRAVNDTKVSKEIFDKKVSERARKLENAENNNPAATPKEDKLFGMPKYLAIGLIVVAILIVIFVIMRMRSK